MSQRKNSRKPLSRLTSWKQELSQWLWLGGVGLAVVVAAFLIIRNNQATPQASPVDQAAAALPIGTSVAGAPRISVDQDTIDVGDQALGTTIQTVFHIRNVGDQPLQILNVPKVQVVVGCCAPTPVLSTNVIQPGQEATLTLNYMMHQGMGGKHRFNIDLKTNDPTQPTKQLVLFSNWI